MKNCYVEKLKGSSNNENLPELGVLTIKAHSTASGTPRIDITKANQNTKVYDGSALVATLTDTVATVNLQNSKNYTVKIGNKYNIVQINFAPQASWDKIEMNLDDFEFVTIDTPTEYSIPFGRNGVYGNLSYIHDYLFSLASTANIIYNFESGCLVAGTLDDIPTHQNIGQFYNYSPNLTGDVRDFSTAVGITRLELASGNSIDCSHIKDLFDALYTAGKRTNLVIRLGQDEVNAADVTLPEMSGTVVFSDSGWVVQ